MQKSNCARNWKDYNEALVKRGNITLWFDEEMIEHWHQTEKKKKRGRPKHYSEVAIHCSLTLKALFKLPLRGTEGLIKSMIGIMKLPLKAADYTTLCKRQKTLKVKLPKERNPKEAINIVIDTSGLKIFGEGEWRVRQHGKTQRRRWRKIHIAVNSDSQEIEACVLTEQRIQDCEGLPMLLNEIPKRVKSVIGDGAYDRFSCYEDAEKRKYKGIFPPQHNANTSKVRQENKKKASQGAVEKRDEAIMKSRELGRSQWKKQIGYHRRSLAETAIYRIKTILNNRLSSRVLENQQVEFKIWCSILNKMTLLRTN